MAQINRTACKIPRPGAVVGSDPYVPAQAPEIGNWFFYGAVAALAAVGILHLHWMIAGFGAWVVGFLANRHERAKMLRPPQERRL